MDSFGCDPNTGEGMLATAERVAAQGGFSKAEVDAVTARRWEQYEEALRRLPEALDGADHGRLKRSDEIDADWGIRPAPLETLEGLRAVDEGGVVSYGSQTHPADGCAGLIVTQRAGRGADPLVSGFARVGRGEMPKAPVPAAAAALTTPA